MRCAYWSLRLHPPFLQSLIPPPCPFPPPPPSTFCLQSTRRRCRPPPPPPFPCPSPPPLPLRQISSRDRAQAPPGLADPPPCNRLLPPWIPHLLSPQHRRRRPHSAAHPAAASLCPTQPCSAHSSVTRHTQGLGHLVPTTPDYWRDLQFGFAVDSGAGPELLVSRTRCFAGRSEVF